MCLCLCIIFFFTIGESFECKTIERLWRDFCAQILLSLSIHFISKYIYVYILGLSTRIHSDLNYLNRVFRMWLFGCVEASANTLTSGRMGKKSHIERLTFRCINWLSNKIKWYKHTNVWEWGQWREYIYGMKLTHIHINTRTHKKKYKRTKPNQSEKCWIRWIYVLFGNSNVSHKSHPSWTRTQNKHLFNHFQIIIHVVLVTCSNRTQYQREKNSSFF